ncbi:hypothetical protein EDD80_103293 [Anseongella ginsenosidimutans]|uniref:Uncharacterized protein n=1 Tax=Anseongella ginsenosidimutans TaxID=496056 RepID=A0A4R3KT54_9SPHI|nr:hypothetical protein [Anseongella ginsenosidimutans]QEC53525.1 hypothetical protein FRZ59_15080 [Anseongella ginsenosidimutans]TCS88428.1 hypothetical protein EDD80_103293 [Anseongella ginsenosidimutans]
MGQAGLGGVQEITGGARLIHRIRNDYICLNLFEECLLKIELCVPVVVFELLYCPCSSWSIIRAQQSNRQIEKTNLFKYGNPVTDEQVNFDNFATNFPLCVQNADEIDLLEIDYIGKVESTRQAMKLLRHNIYHNAPAWGISSSYGGTKERDRKSNFFRLSTKSRIDTTQINANEIIDTLANHYIHTGDAVYAIKIVSPEHQTFDYYVFVNSKTKQVVTKGNMLAFDVPLDFIRKKTKNSY